MKTQRRNQDAGLKTGVKTGFQHFDKFIALVQGGKMIVFLLAFVALAVAVRQEKTQVFDEVIRAGIHQFASPAVTIFMRVVTLLGNGIFLWGLGTVIVLWFVWMRWRRNALLFLATMAGAALLNRLLKAGFHRSRPLPFFDTPLPSTHSFPSGHALLGLCFYGMLVGLCTERIASRPVRLSLWVIATMLIVLIGISRVYLGVHYPTDVLAGYAMALLWLNLVLWVKRWTRSF